jgi:hypothetical protein
VGGAPASQIGLRATLFVGAFGGMLAILPIVLSPIPALREFPEPEPELFEPSFPPCPYQRRMPELPGSSSRGILA